MKVESLLETMENINLMTDRGLPVSVQNYSFRKKIKWKTQHLFQKLSTALPCLVLLNVQKFLF